VTGFMPVEPGVLRVKVRASGPEQARSEVLRAALAWFGAGFPVAAESCEMTGDGVYVVRLAAGQDPA
jgi:hypothetical protein